MAKKVTVNLIDDIDGKVFEPGKGEHISNSVNGVDYEIDLSNKNAKEFHRKLDYYITRSIRVGGRRKRKTAAGSGLGDRERAKTIRDWATREGYNVAERGRISEEVQNAFDQAH